MFSRRPDRPKEEPRYATSTAKAPDQLVAVPVANPSAIPAEPAQTPASGAPAAASGGGETIVALGDHVDGQLRSREGVRIIGSFAGTIESDSYVRMGEQATVKADVTADEIVVAGEYEGTLVARGRLEIAATGRIKGSIETPRLMLHEGGFIDGALHMQPQPRPDRNTEVARIPSAREAPAEPALATRGRSAAATSGSPAESPTTAAS
jgi:cytoskeletal protein CcmA (bactofilin family)